MACTLQKVVIISYLGWVTFVHISPGIAFYNILKHILQSTYCVLFVWITSGFLTHLSYARALRPQTFVQHFKSCFIANSSFCKTCDLFQLRALWTSVTSSYQVPWSCGPRHKSQKCESHDHDSFNAFHSNGIGNLTIERTGMEPWEEGRFSQQTFPPCHSKEVTQKSSKINQVSLHHIQRSVTH